MQGAKRRSLRQVRAVQTSTRKALSPYRFAYRRVGWRGKHISRVKRTRQAVCGRREGQGQWGRRGGGVKSGGCRAFVQTRVIEPMKEVRPLVVSIWRIGERRRVNGTCKGGCFCWCAFAGALTTWWMVKEGGASQVLLSSWVAGH